MLQDALKHIESCKFESTNASVMEFMHWYAAAGKPMEAFRDIYTH